MSGIFGLIKPNQPSDIEATLQNMGQSLNHRPWYQVDHQANPRSNIGLGRVGIGIFNPEPQPVTHDDHSVTVVMAGEFYSQDRLQQKLDKTPHAPLPDSHLALQLYQQYGLDFVKQVEGIFSIAIWDKAQHKLYLLNDRFGLKPLYYAQLAETFIFAPEMKGILVEPACNRSLNLTAMAEFIRFQQVIGEKTFFDEIKLMQPASICSIDLRTLAFEQAPYWDWRAIKPLKKTSDKREIFEETERLFKQAVHKRLPSDHRLGMFLSGGLDSRCILAVMPPSDVPIVTVSYGHPDSRDVRIARRIAQAMDTDHHVFEFLDGQWAKEVSEFHMELVEGAHSWIHAHGLSTLPDARELFDINLSGIGAGVITGTFEAPVVSEPPDQEAMLNLLFRHYTQTHSWPGLTEAEAQGLLSETYHSKLNGLAYESLKAEVARFAHADPYLQSFFFNLYNHDRRMILNFIIFNNSHIENRCPFLDYELVDWATTVPVEYKLDKPMHSFILSRTMPKLSHIPRDKDYGLPTTNRFLRTGHSLYHRLKNRLNQGLGSQKRGPYAETLYADYENYLRHELREWAEGILFDSRTLDRAIFRPEAVRSLMDRHISGKELLTLGKISHLITFEMMLRRYFDE